MTITPSVIVATTITIIIVTTMIAYTTYRYGYINGFLHATDLKRRYESRIRSVP